MGIRIFLAGRVAVEAGDVLIDDRRFPGRQGRLVFAHLVVDRDTPVPHDVLAEMLWGESPPPTWRKALTVIVCKLRVLLGECGIEGDKALTSAFGCYRLELPAGTWVDVVAATDAAQAGAEALAAGDLQLTKELALRAASLARPPFLPGDEGAWVEGKRHELADVLGRALVCLAEASSRSGDPSGAVRWAEEAITLEPFRESGYRQLMAAHVAAGNRAEALRVYERCRRLLADELGAFPSPETQSVYRELLRAPPIDTGAAAVDGTAVVAAAPSGTQPANNRRRRPPRTAIAGALVLVLAAVVAAVAELPGRDRSSSPAIRADAAVALDTSGKILASVTVGSGPVRVAVGENAIWVANAHDGTISRIDPVANAVVQTIEVGAGPAGLAVGNGAVWVTNGFEGTLSRIDTSANRLVQTIRLPNGPRGVAYGEGAVWVANLDDRSVSRVDPASGSVLRTIPAGGTPTAIAAGAGSVWVTNESDGSVSRISPSANAVVQMVNVGSGPGAVAAGLGAIWVANTRDGTVSRIDPMTGTVTATVSVGKEPRDLAVGLGSVWVANELSGTVSRIDPRTMEVVSSNVAASRPTGIVVGPRAAWVTVRAAADAHRGGTLTLATQHRPDSIDPAMAYRTDSWQVLSVTGDGLTAPRRVGGPAGATIVPDLAASLPTPVDGGRTYTFQLRSGIRYSTGALVAPADVRSSYERLFEVGSPGAGYYVRIVGAARCARGRRCDLSRGIVTDAAAGTVTFHLTAPDPEFLNKVGLPFGFILPATAPRRDIGTRPLPATGPYVIAAYDPRRELRLVRNPHFREWSGAARPPGYPDEIVLRIGLTRNAALDAVESGRLDYTWKLPQSRLAEVATQYANRFHATPTANIEALLLNTRATPFDRPAPRQALSLAVDRRAAVALFGGSRVSQPACQILPPNFPAHEPYCPYTAGDARDGLWHGADIAAARKLIARSGTRAKRIIVVTQDFSAWVPVARYTVRLLHGLGYDASYEVLSDDDFSARVASPAGWQIAVTGWAPDYPSAGGIIAANFACNAAANITGLCEPKIDAEIERAQTLQTTQGRAADDLWARLDRQLVDRAPWVPLVNVRTTDLVSQRVGNYQVHPQWGVLLDQLWIR